MHVIIMAAVLHVGRLSPNISPPLVLTEGLGGEDVSSSKSLESASALSFSPPGRYRIMKVYGCNFMAHLASLPFSCLAEFRNTNALWSISMTNGRRQSDERRPPLPVPPTPWHCTGVPWAVISGNRTPPVAPPHLSTH